MQEDNTYYVYRHRRLDDFSIFYVGMSEVYEIDSYANSEKVYYRRAYVKGGKKNYWNNIVNKHGYQVEIVAENLTKEEACELEMFLIKEYGRADLKEGRLVNNTDGGEGSVRQSEEVIQGKRDRFRGEGNPMYGRKGELNQRSIPVYEVSTGKRFPSYTSASEYLGMDIREFSSRITCQGNRKNNTGFLHVEESKNCKTVDRRRNVKIIDFTTGEIIDSQSEACRRCGISLKYWTNGYCKKL